MSEQNKRKGFWIVTGVCGILGTVLPLSLVILATFLSSWFSWSANALSEMGVGEQAWLFNSAVMLGGFLNFIFVVGLYRFLKNNFWNRLGVICLFISSICLGLVGIFTVDSMVLHGIFAGGYFLLTPAGFIFISKGAQDTFLRRLGLVCGIGALLSILVLPFGIFSLPFNVGFAVPELIESLFIMFWTIYASFKLIKTEAI